MGLFTWLAIAGTSAVQFALRLLALGAALVQLAIFTAMFFWQLGLDIYRFVLNNRLAAMVLTLVVLLGFFLLPFGATHTSDLIETYNMVMSCFGRPAYEFIDRVIVRHFIEAYDITAVFWNNLWLYFRGTLITQSVLIAQNVECVLSGGSVSQLFDIPTNLWIIVASVLTGTLQAPRPIRSEPMAPGTFGYHAPELGGLAVRDTKFDHDPLYDAQGIPDDPAPYFSLPYFAELVWKEFVVFWDQLGHFFVKIVSDLGRPAQRLMPALIVEPVSEESLWRRVGDLACHGTEILAFTASYPYFDPANPTQPARESLTGFWCPMVRELAGFGATASIYVIHLTTRNLPTTEIGGTCDPEMGTFGPPQPDANSFFRGFPFVDLFLPSGNNNLVIFRHNIVFCRYQKMQPFKACGGLARGSYSYIGFPLSTECPEWDGTSTPLATERINYIGLAVRRVGRIAELLFNQEALSDTSLDQTIIEQMADIATSILNLIFDGLIFLVNSFFAPTCSTGRAMSTWFGYELGAVVISTIEFFFQDSCVAAIEPASQEDNIFLCIIAMAARAAPGTFWTTICELVDDIPFTGIQITCQNRKRSVDEFAQPLGAGGATLTYAQHARLHAAYYASHTRQALGAFAYCALDERTSRLGPAHCESECSMRPCVDATLACVHERLGESDDTVDNYWRSAALPDSYWASLARGTAMAADTFAGCRDGDAARFTDAMNATMHMAQDAAMRSAFAAQEFGSAHARCSRDSDGDSAAYRECIGLVAREDGTPSDLTPLQQSRIALAAHGVHNGTTPCANLLYRFGVGVLTDDDTIDAVNDEHERYRACSMLLAYGARARALGSTALPLTDFIDEWRVPLAMSAATELLSREDMEAVRNFSQHAMHFERSDRHWVDSLLDAGEAVVDGERRFRLTGEFANATENAPDESAHITVHNVLSSAYAYFNYLADVHEQIMLADTDASEKDAHDAALFARHMVPVAASIVERSSVVRVAQRELHRSLQQQREQNSGIRQVTRVFLHSLRWVDRMHSDIENVATMAHANGDGLSTVMSGGRVPGGTGVEFALEQHVSGRRAPINLGTTLAMRVLADDSQLARSLVLADLQGLPHYAALRHNGSVPMQPFVRIRLLELRDALVAASKNVNVLRTAAQRAESDRALAAIASLDRRMSAISLDGDSLAARIGFGSAGAVRMVMRVAWNLVNRRLRLDAIPAVQAAHVIVDALSGGGDSRRLEQWMAGDQQYIVGVGYVENELYDNYMHSTEEWRDAVIGRALPSESGAAWPSSPQHIVAARVRRQLAPATLRQRVIRESVRAALSASEQTHQSADTRQLPGSTTYARWLKRRRARLLRPAINFRHRARTLLAHDVHHLDVHTFALAGRRWHAHRLAVHAASNNGTEAHRRVVAALAASEIATGRYWLDLLDDAIGWLLGSRAPSVSLADRFDTFVFDLTVAATDVLDDFVLNAQDFFDSLVSEFPCNPDQDVRAGGTGTYKGGCLPLLPERATDFHVNYPAPIGPQYAPPTQLSYGGFLNFFRGPGFAQWPDDMLAPGGNCPILRDPDQVSNALSFWSTPITYVSMYSQTNMCRRPDVQASPAYPKCANAVQCDYCERTWLNSVDLGFTDGVRNIEVFSQMIRTVAEYTWQPIAADGFWFVIALVLIYDFAYILPPWLGLIANIAWFGILIGELFVQQTPERALFAYLTIVLSGAIGAGLYWLVFVAYVVNLFQVKLFNKTATLFGDWIMNKLLFHLSPDNVLRWSLDKLGKPLATLISPIFDFRATIDALVVRLEASVLIGTPAFREGFHSFMSIANFIQLLVFTFIAYKIARFLIGYVLILFPAIGGFFKFFYNLYIRIRDYLVRRRVSATEEDVEDLESAAEGTEAKLERLSAQVARIAAFVQLEAEQVDEELAVAQRQRSALDKKTD